METYIVTGHNVDKLSNLDEMYIEAFQTLTKSNDKMLSFAEKINLSRLVELNNFIYGLGEEWIPVLANSEEDALEIAKKHYRREINAVDLFFIINKE